MVIIYHERYLRKYKTWEIADEPLIYGKVCEINTYIYISSVQHLQLATFVEVFWQMTRVYVALTLSYLSLSQGTAL